RGSTPPAAAARSACPPQGVSRDPCQTIEGRALAGRSQQRPHDLAGLTGGGQQRCRQELRRVLGERRGPPRGNPVGGRGVGSPPLADRLDQDQAAPALPVWVPRRWDRRARGGGAGPPPAGPTGAPPGGRAR